VVRERDQVRRQTVAGAKLRKVQAEIYARPTWVWTVLEPDSPGRVVGAAIRSRQATDDDLAPLANLSDLVWLNLNDTQVTDAGLAHLTKLKDLERLRLDGTSIGDRGLAYLVKLDKLRQLNLDNTRISDAGLIHLKEMKNRRDVPASRSGKR
jgi:hypothetical protein